MIAIYHSTRQSRILIQEFIYGNPIWTNHRAFP